MFGKRTVHRGRAKGAKDYVTPVQVAEMLRASIGQSVRVTYTDGKTKELLLHTLDDEGLVCDIVRPESSDPPEYAY